MKLATARGHRHSTTTALLLMLMPMIVLLFTMYLLASVESSAWKHKQKGSKVPAGSTSTPHGQVKYELRLGIGVSNRFLKCTSSTNHYNNAHSDANK
jgi:hypothetical protein